MNRDEAPIRTALDIPSGRVTLQGDLTVPQDAAGIVVFAHGSGSSRHSVRNRAVAGHLQGEGLATLLMDLLTHDEEIEEQQTRHLRFDIDLLSRRLEDATRFVSSIPAMTELPVGYFGASTGAAAALVAAASVGDSVSAVVSRGGRPDLAGSALGRVTTPTLLIVGGADTTVIGMNETALREMPSAATTLTIIPGATHLFAEPGALHQVAVLAADWFGTHLTTVGQTRSREA